MRHSNKGIIGQFTPYTQQESQVSAQARDGNRRSFRSQAVPGLGKLSLGHSVERTIVTNWRLFRIRSTREACCCCQSSSAATPGTVIRSADSCVSGVSRIPSRRPAALGDQADGSVVQGTATTSTPARAWRSMMRKPPRWLNFASSRAAVISPCPEVVEAFDGAYVVEPDEPLKRQSNNCGKTGADPEAILAWIQTSRQQRRREPGRCAPAPCAP